MPKTAVGEPALRTPPVQVAKRKQKPLGHEEVVTRKRSKITRVARDEEDETPNAQDEQSEPKIFISPEQYIGEATIGNDNEPPNEFVSPLKYMVLAGEGREIPALKRKKRAGRHKNQESRSKHESCSNKPSENDASTRSLHNGHSSTQQLSHGEKSSETPSDRFVTGAQEDLMQMIEEGASDLAIVNQIKIIKLFRTRLQSQEESQKSGTQYQQLTEDLEKNSRSKSIADDVPKVSRSTPAPRHPLSMSSDSESSSFSRPTPSPGPRKRGRPAQNSTNKAKVSRETKELLKTARPASAPTSLPAAQRTNKSLTTQEVASLSKTHPTFDEKETNKFDRHTRKINSTKGMASDRPLMPDRGLESRIRAPTSSPEELPRGERRNNGGARLTAESLKAVDSAAASSSGFPIAGDKPTPTHPPKKSTLPATSNHPGKDGVNTSPRELEQSVQKMNLSLATQRMVSRAAAAAAAALSAAPSGQLQQQQQQQQQIRRPGQVFNAALKRWQFVEEVDSDDD